MTTDEVRIAVLDALHQIVPDVDTHALRPDVSVREQVDMDSVDFLRFLVVVHNTLGVNVPEADYHQMRTIDGTVAYIASRLAGKA